MLRTLLRYIRQPQYRSAGLTFLLMSVMYALWIIRLPEIRDKLHLSEGQIGVALFFIPIGALSAMLVSHALNKKVGEGRLMTIALLLTALTSLLPVVAGSLPVLCAGLLLFGFSSGLTDISMNALVSIFEKRDGVQIMSVSHGFFSLGGIFGPLLGTLLYSLGLNIVLQLGMAALLVILLDVLVIYPNVSEERDIDHSEGRDPFFAIPKGFLIPLAIIGFCSMMGEGAIADWSSIYMDDVTSAPAFMLGFGYAAFSVTMTIGRFFGDTITARLGRKKVVIYGCVLVIAGIGLVLTGSMYIVLLGFAVVGVGYSAMIPVLFSIAGSVPGVSSSFGIASVGTAGYTGFLIGPVVLGILAEYQGLQVSFLLLILLSVISLITAFRGM